MTTTNNTAASYCILSDGLGGFYPFPEVEGTKPITDIFTIYRTGLASRSQAERVAIRLEYQYEKSEEEML